MMPVRYFEGDQGVQQPLKRQRVDGQGASQSVRRGAAVAQFLDYSQGDGSMYRRGGQPPEDESTRGECICCWPCPIRGVGWGKRGRHGHPILMPYVCGQDDTPWPWSGTYRSNLRVRAGRCPGTGMQQGATEQPGKCPVAAGGQQ